MPRPRRRFKRDLPGLVAAEQQAHPEATLELWAMDEHRVGLKPILRRVWAPRGQRPIAVVHPRYEWMYVIGFVQPEKGKTSLWVVSHVDAEVFSLILGAFAAEQGVSETKRLMLVLDGAGWHTAGRVEVPPGMSFVKLPPYSPELQPSERLWPLCNEPLANRTFDSIEDLEVVLSDRCCEIFTMHDHVRDLTNYHWWPSTTIDK
jgi:transposase